MNTYIVEQVDRPSYYDRVYTPDEFREEIHERNKKGVGFFDLAVIESESRPSAVSDDDPRLTDRDAYDFI